MVFKLVTFFEKLSMTLTCDRPRNSNGRGRLSTFDLQVR
jgi:hypothetical protein